MSSSITINEILIYLKNTFTSTDKNIRVQSEQKLSELKDLNIIIFTSKLLDIIKQNSQEVDKEVKLSIILLLKRSIKEKIEKEELDQNSNNQLIQLYITILVNPSLSKKELENLGDTFSIILNNSRPEILIEIINYINKEISSMPLGSVNGVISILSSIIQSPSLTQNFFISALDGILPILLSIVQNLYVEYEKLNIEQNLENYLKFNNMFMNAFELLFQCNFKSSKRFKIKDKNISNKFNNLFIIGAKLLVNLKSKDNNRIISWSGNEKIDKNINSLKIKIFRFLNLQVKDLGNLILDQNKVEMHEQLIRIIVSNLEWVIMNKYTYLIELESEKKPDYLDYYYTLIISLMFIYLQRIFNIHDFIFDFTNHFNNMYKNILLPLLLITNLEEEIALDNESVNGYCIDVKDIIYDNKEKKIKSAVAGLIKVFYEKNITSNSFMIKYTVILIESLIGSNEKLNDRTLFEENDIIILLLKIYDKEKIICALFLALNIISQVSNSKNYYINNIFLHDFFEKSFNNLVKLVNYPCLKHQIILFICNYALRFFEPDSDGFKTSLNYLFNGLFEKKYSLISNASADSIHHFFKIKNEDSSNIKYTLLKVATLNICNFEESIKNTQISNFFDVLYQILISFEKRDSEFFKKIFENICKRVNVEVERHFRLKFKVKKEKNKAKKKATAKTNLNDYNIIINKCFNIIRMLMHNEKFVINNMQLIEKSLEPLVLYMENPKKIEFDEDIIAIVHLIITHNKKITPLACILIRNLYKYCDKVGGLLLDLYMLINSYLAYGTDEILSNEEMLLGIMAVFKSGLKGTKYKNSPFYTCILMQIWLINCKKLSNNTIVELVEFIIPEINTIFNNYKLENIKSLGDDLYNYLGYITLILCGLINYSPIIISEFHKISNQNPLKDYFQILKNENEPGFEYEIKIIIYSLSILITNNIINEDIQDYLDICIDLLKCQEYNAKYDYKKNYKKNLNLKFIDSDDEGSNENDDDSENELTDFREIKDLIEKTINPIKDIDEFKKFNELLLFLKQNNNNNYILWENSLDPKKKEEVYKLFSTKRIDIQINKDNNIQIPRRIVAIKRVINSNK